MKYVLLTLLVLAAVFVVVVLRRALRTYLKFRGKMLVSCPETHLSLPKMSSGPNAFEISEIQD